MTLEPLLEKRKTTSAKPGTVLKELSTEQQKTLLNILKEIESFDKLSKLGAGEEYMGCKDLAAHGINQYFNMVETYKALGYNVRAFLYPWKLLEN